MSNLETALVWMLTVQSLTWIATDFRRWREPEYSSYTDELDQ